MTLKKSDISEVEMNQILHSLLVVNELPILEDPKYMDRCAKIFYATFSELPDSSSVKIIRMWARWQTDELRILLDKLQQYITVCAISKNLDEESNNRANENEDDEINESEKNCLHKSEGKLLILRYSKCAKNRIVLNIGHFLKIFLFSMNFRLIFPNSL